MRLRLHIAAAAKWLCPVDTQQKSAGDLLRHQLEGPTSCLYTEQAVPAKPGVISIPRSRPRNTGNWRKSASAADGKTSGLHEVCTLRHVTSSHSVEVSTARRTTFVHL